MRNFFVNEDYNTRLYESDHFIVIPSLGSLIEGWLLIVPKEFHLNFSQLEPFLYEELELVINYLERQFLPKLGSENYVLFEHGPSFENSLAGCGVDYAHLHFVPIKLDLLTGISKYLSLDYEWQKMQTLSSLVCLKNQGCDYLYLRDQFGSQYFTVQQNIPSQTFRKVIASYLDSPNNYDWKENYGLQKVNETIKKLSFQAV